MEKNHCAAMSAAELMDVLYLASVSLKNQALDSPVLKHPQCAEIRDRLDKIAGELQGLQMDIALAVPQQDK